jgi:RHS repeat-associated protein
VVAQRAGSELRSPSQDGLGSTVGATSGTTTGPTTRYWPSGELREPQGELPTDRRFTGQRLEARTGLSDYQARFSSPQLGRCLQPDTLVPEPSNPQGLNRYAYALNNPLRYTDPSGHYKDVAELGWERQLRAQHAWAQKHGYTYQLIIRRSTIRHGDIAGDIKQLQRGGIDIRFIEDILQ